MNKILIVDDELVIRNALVRILKKSYECITAADAEQALEELDKNPDTALVLTDYKMPPGMNGIELIREVKKRKPLTGCVIMTAFADVDLAVKAFTEGGADHFITKPVHDINVLEASLEKALKPYTLEKRVAQLEKELQENSLEVDGFIGSSERMREMYKTIRQVAPSTAPVLILGPTGTGKELVARAIHKLSNRANGPFIPVECSAFPANLLETELFGTVKGAYTDAIDRPGRFEAADGGTIFIDEIGELPLEAQVKLLRVLQERVVERVGKIGGRKIDFRLVAATNRDLRQLVAEGAFREDLYYRLNVIEIRTPALKEHPEDIAELAENFTKEFSAANGNRVTGLSPQLIEELKKRPWPGNVRQLRSVIETMVVLSSGGELTEKDLPAEESPLPAKPQEHSLEETLPTLTSAMNRDKRSQLSKTLAICGGNRSKAAELLGVTRRTIQRWISEETKGK